MINVFFFIFKVTSEYRVLKFRQQTWISGESRQTIATSMKIHLTKHTNREKY